MTSSHCFLLYSSMFATVQVTERLESQHELAFLTYRDLETVCGNASVVVVAVVDQVDLHFRTQ